MKIYESAEDYLERILMLSKTLDKVRSIDVAKNMGYSKPSISRAINALADNGYLTIKDNGELVLTDEGLRIANKIYERHELLSKYFMAIGVSEETARKDACKIEHDLSDETFEAIKNHYNIFK